MSATCHHGENGEDRFARPAAAREVGSFWALAPLDLVRLEHSDRGHEEEVQEPGWEMVQGKEYRGPTMAWIVAAQTTCATPMCSTTSCCASTPLSIVVMGLAVQLKHLGLEMDPRWIPRGQNSEADSLTSSEFMGFDPPKRTTIDSEKTKFKVMIMELDDEIKLVKSSKKTQADRPVGSMTKRKRVQTRCDGPWQSQAFIGVPASKVEERGAGKANGTKSSQQLNGCCREIYPGSWPRTARRQRTEDICASQKK